MVISVRISEEEGHLIKAYTSRKGITVSHFLRQAVIDQLEGDYTLTPEEMEVVRELTAYTPQSFINL